MVVHHLNRPLLLCLLFISLRLTGADKPEIHDADIVIYGGSSAAITAAVQTMKMGLSAVIVCPDVHLGGLSVSGLGWTDAGNTAAVGGLAREFYHRIFREYQQPEAWIWQSRDTFENQGQGTAAIKEDEETMWVFEPHVAERVFSQWLVEAGVQVFPQEALQRDGGVVKREGRIISFQTLSGKEFRARMFIDATYEGDLMAAAGISYTVGREANAQYGETWNGIQTGVLHHSHYFDKEIDPYVVAGDPGSGLLPRISSEPPGIQGEGDRRVQAYCFRMCLTNHPENRVPFAKPEGYDPFQYELLLRVFNAGWRKVYAKYDPIPNRKTDTNNHGPFSTDNIGKNYRYPEASYEERLEIIQEHVRYQRGLLYFMTYDPRVPEEIRSEMSQWGLAKDEFCDNDHWPYQFYVREARRMIGKYVMTEHDVLGRRETPEPVGMGSYTLDSHNVQRYVTAEGFVQNEGDIGVTVPHPYRIAYGALIPREDECLNLLTPVCCSCSHIAFGSIRMEPVFMILGQSAATAAALAIRAGCAVQHVDYPQLREQLLADHQRL